MNLTPQQKRDLAELLDYCWRDEERSFLELRNEKIDTRHHVFHRLRRLRAALETAKAAPVRMTAYVSGGVVQAVLATDPRVQMTVLDADGDLREQNEQAWNKLCRRANQHAVY